MPHAVNDGVRIHYEIVGHGPDLLLHIGLFGALEDWHAAGYVAALQESYRLVLLDPRASSHWWGWIAHRRSTEAPWCYPTSSRFCSG